MVSSHVYPCADAQLDLRRLKGRTLQPSLNSLILARWSQVFWPTPHRAYTQIDELSQRVMPDLKDIKSGGEKIIEA